MSSHKPARIAGLVAVTLMVAGVLTAGAWFAEPHLQPLITAAQMPSTAQPSGITSLAVFLGGQCQAEQRVLRCSH